MSRSATIAALAIIAILALVVTGIAVDTRDFGSTVLCRPLSKVDALNFAITHNGTILQAQKDVEAQIGVAIQTKAIIYPVVTGTGNYHARQDTLIETNQLPKKTIEIPSAILPVLDANGNPVVPEEHIATPGREMTIGGQTLPKKNNQDWITEIRIIQSIYEGGRLLSAVRSSRLIRERAFLIYETTVADTLQAVSIAYDDVLSTGKQIVVHQEAVTTLAKLAKDTRIRGDVGDRPEFDVLRAEVELVNEEAALMRAVGAYRVAKQFFVELLGYDVPVTESDDLPLQLTTPLQALLYPRPLSEALVDALARRSEIAARQTEIRLRNEAIIVAKAGWKPSVQAVGGYQLTSRTQARNAGHPLYGAYIGVQATVPIFDGFLTKGKVVEAVALRDRACETKAETVRIVEREVRTAWSDLRTATDVLELQTKNVRRAENAMCLAEARYKEGEAPQVTVLNAQTALTRARTDYYQALRDYSVARTRLLHATGEIVEPFRVK